MGTETVYLATSISGDAHLPSRALGPPDGVWAGNDGGFVNWSHTWGFADPVAPVLAAGTQQVVVPVRRFEADGTTPFTVTIRRGQTVLASTTVDVAAGTSSVTLEWSDPGGSSQGLTLQAASTGAFTVSVQIDAATWTALVEGTPDPDPSPWSVWENGVEVPVTMSVFEGGVEIPVT